MIKIEFAGTNLEQRAFSPLTQGMQLQSDGLEHPSAEIWHQISVQNRTFLAAGDSSKLEFLLQVFLDWAEK